MSQLDAPWLQWSRRVSYILVALSLVWSVLYLDRPGWQPWSTEFLLVVALNLMFFTRAVILFHHRHDEDADPDVFARLRRIARR